MARYVCKFLVDCLNVVRGLPIIVYVTGSWKPTFWAQANFLGKLK